MFLDQDKHVPLGQQSLMRDQGNPLDQSNDIHVDENICLGQQCMFLAYQEEDLQLVQERKLRHVPGGCQGVRDMIGTNPLAKTKLKR